MKKIKNILLNVIWVFKNCGKMNLVNCSIYEYGTVLKTSGQFNNYSTQFINKTIE